LKHAIVKTLNDTGLAPNRLVLEITESVFLLDESHLTPFFGELRGMGIKIALDDFGTGYSSLSLLQNIPFDELKVDQSLIKQIGENTKTEESIKTIAKLGGLLEMTLVAEGVENERQLEFLRELGCQCMQGYLYGAPVTNDRFLGKFTRESEVCPV